MLDGAALAVGAWAAGAVALGWSQREVRAHRREARFAARFPSGLDGIVSGAHPRRYEGDRDRAVLLLHGYNDSPQSLDQVARVIHGAGWTVRVPLLPGHGRSLRAFDGWTESDVLAHAREEYAALRATHRTVVVGGLSMGGALACWLGAESDAAGVLLYAPMLFVPRPIQLVVSTARLWSLMTKYVSGGGRRSLHDPAAARTMIAYGSSTRRSLEALERLCLHTTARLGFIHSPVLVAQSEEDNRLPHDQSVRAIARIGSNDKTVIWTRGAGHVVTLDRGWQELAATSAAWLDSRFPAVGTGRVAG
jgi:carboxylesterase